MKIRYKLMLILGLITVSLMASLFVVANNLLFSSIAASENKTASSNALRFLKNLNIQLFTMNNTVKDWSAWDDTYLFIENNNADYILSNLVDQAFCDINLNMILFFDKSDQLVFGKMHDLSSKTSTAPEERLIEQILASNSLFAGNITHSNQGIILLNGVPMLVASHPILTSLHEGPARGTMIIGRYFDDSEIALLSEANGLPLSITVLGDSQVSADVEFAAKNLSMDKPIFTQAINETTIAGYVLIQDVNGNPALIARVDDYRSEFAQGKGSMTSTALSLIAIGITTFLVIAVLLDRLVVSRLSALNDTVTKIWKTGDNSKRAAIKGNDELSSLSENINSMLDVIDKYTLSLEKTVKERTRDLAENQEKLKSILLASPDAIIAADLEGKITECNSQLTQLSGLSRDSLLGKTALHFVAEKERQKVEERLTEAAVNKEGIIRFEATLLRGDQTQFPAEVSANVIWNEKDSPVGYVAVVRDLSERKLLEQRLFRSERLAAIGELAGMVGHDLRNPLTAIKNASYFLKKKCSTCKRTKPSQMLKTIDKSIEHANKIVNDLLEYSREINLELTVCSPQGLLRDALLLVKVPKNIKLKNSTTDIQFYADANKVLRVYVNLMRNAFDAMPTGGNMEVCSSQQNGFANISFTDSGVGISEDMILKIFTPLFTTKAQGMGFGLSISKRIVEAHGGKIWLKSAVGAGTTVTISFPLVPKPLEGKDDWVALPESALLASQKS